MQGLRFRDVGFRDIIGSIYRDVFWGSIGIM